MLTLWFIIVHLYVHIYFKSNRHVISNLSLLLLLYVLLYTCTHIYIGDNMRLVKVQVCKTQSRLAQVSLLSHGDAKKNLALKRYRDQINLHPYAVAIYFTELDIVYSWHANDYKLFVLFTLFNRRCLIFWDKDILECTFL